MVSDLTTSARSVRSASAGGFTRRSIAFLRSLERHNRREWFHAHKDRYEADVRAPMIALVERLAADLGTFAPDLVANPRTSIYRPYRDTRFAADKAPLKTNVAAVFPHRLLPKHEGAGFYLEVAPRHVWFGGGMYMPSSSHLHQVREHIATQHRRLTRIVGAPSFRRAFGALEGAKLQRVPRGFPSDHPAAELLKYRQFLAACERSAEFATTPTFYRTLLAAWKTLAPLVHFLNEPLVAGLQADLPGRAWTDAET